MIYTAQKILKRFFNGVKRQQDQAGNAGSNPSQE